MADYKEGRRAQLYSRAQGLPLTSPESRPCTVNPTVENDEKALPQDSYAVDPTVKMTLLQDTGNHAGDRRPQIPHPRSHVCRYTVVNIADLRVETS